MVRAVIIQVMWSSDARVGDLVRTERGWVQLHLRAPLRAAAVTAVAFSGAPYCLIDDLLSD
jgi:hypothetical protein